MAMAGSEAQIFCWIERRKRDASNVKKVLNDGISIIYFLGPVYQACSLWIALDEKGPPDLFQPRSEQGLIVYVFGKGICLGDESTANEQKRNEFLPVSCRKHL
jgi:hypothetical protein